jgi:hypothetical protein
MLSSSWESEQKTHRMVNWSDPKNNWQRPEIRAEISKFQDTQIEAEFAAAVEQHRVEEVYWVGGEPLMYEQHWRYMQRIIELGDGGKFMQDIIPILVVLSFVVLIYIGIFWIMYVTGRFAHHLTAQEPLENTSEPDSITDNFEKTSNKD